MHQIIHSFTYPLSIHSSTPSFIHPHLSIHSYFPPFHPSFAPPFLYFLPNFIHYIRSLIRSYILTFIHSFIDSSIHHTFIHSFIHPIVRSFIHAPVHSIPCIDSSIHSFTHWFWFIHTYIHTSNIHSFVAFIHWFIAPVPSSTLTTRLAPRTLRRQPLSIAVICWLPLHLPLVTNYRIVIHKITPVDKCRPPGPAAPPGASAIETPPPLIERCLFEWAAT